MPITQERFMTVVEGAKRLLNIHEDVKATLNDDLHIDLTNANAVLSHTADVQAKSTIQTLLSRIMNAREQFLSMRDKETNELMAIVLAEEIHFKKVERRNITARYNQSQARRSRGAVPRQPEVEPNRPDIRPKALANTIDPVPEDFRETADYKKFTEEMDRKWQADQTKVQQLPSSNGSIQITGNYAPGRKANLPTIEEMNAKDAITPGDTVL